MGAQPGLEHQLEAVLLQKTLRQQAVERRWAVPRANVGAIWPTEQSLIFGLRSIALFLLGGQFRLKQDVWPYRFCVTGEVARPRSQP